MSKSLTTEISRDDGFTLTELLMATAIALLLIGAALTTFQNAMSVSDAGTQISDANQNLRAGINQLIRDVMEAGRLIGPGGVPIPGGTGAVPVMRPAPPGQSLTFNVSTTTNLPDITTGYQLGPTIDGETTDMLTLITLDPFMPSIETPPIGGVDPNEGTLANDGSYVTLPTNSYWLVGNPANGTPAASIGDLVLFNNTNGLAIQTITGMDSSHLYFATNDVFHFNQRSAPQGSVTQIMQSGGGFPSTTLFRLLMITYYVDNITTPGSPRLVRQVDNYAPQQLAGVVEDLNFDYDLVDGIYNPAGVMSLPWYDQTHNVTYDSNQIRKVNIHVGVRSQFIVQPTGDFVRNHLTTSVDVRSLASVQRYVEP